jgi:hypothetical protein
MARKALNADIEKLPAEVDASLREWSQGSKSGLWICGPRRSGSSYIAEAVINKLDSLSAISSWEHIDAFDLTQALRNLWNIQEQQRHHPEDYGLFEEWSAHQEQQDFIWNKCEVLWIDDFHQETVDIRFWRKHVQPRVEQRVKRGMATIIATTLVPDEPELDGLEQVITDLFVVCNATR